MRYLTILLGLILMSCTQTDPSPKFRIDFEKFELANGLDVVLHVDRSDPVVAVALTAHVGSAREKAGRTGFAHLFEHLLFLESENLGKGGLDKLSARVGGSGANGSTSRDRTNYFQTVPKDALEKMLWAEADKLGWFINTVTEPVLAKEKQVVKNEKRQSVDNRPYGHTWYVIDKALYPEDHPYNWQVIGSLDDLQAATLADVKEFFKRWYVPNNVTLVVSGDIDVEKTKVLVKKYFDEIPRGQDVEPLKARPGVVGKTRLLIHEDNFARLPELTLNWPTVKRYHPDAYALNVLAQYLSNGKEAPLNQVLIDDKKLTANVRVFNRNDELAGQLQIAVRGFAATNLNDVRKGIFDGLAIFEKNGIPQADLDRIKAAQETRFYNGLSSVLGKGFQLAQYNIFAGDPGFVSTDIENILTVSREDVMRVYKTYIKDQNYIATSFVPKGKRELALDGSELAAVVEEKIVPGAEDTFDASRQAEFERTPSRFDRTVEPPYGEKPAVNVPDVYSQAYANGMSLHGIVSSEVPLVRMNLVFDGGQRTDQVDGVANLTALMLDKGTKSKTRAELEAAIQQLGATININATRDEFRVSATTLARNYQKTLDLITEMLTQPRWDADEFETAKRSVINQLRGELANPNAIAQIEFDKLLYSETDPRSKNLRGSFSSVETLTIDDLKTFLSSQLQSSKRMHVVGDVPTTTVQLSVQALDSVLPAATLRLKRLPQPKPVIRSTVYFYDVPGAKQSVLQIGYPSMAVTDDDYYPAMISNYILGGGGFASRLTQELRERKGYTYGIRSRFGGDHNSGEFTIRSGVRTNVTLESLQLIKDILKQYGSTFSEKDLETTKGFLIKSNARAFETADAKLGILENISSYGWPADYVKAREKTVEAMDIPTIQKLAGQYLNPDRMIWLVVGDAKTQLSRLSALGYGDPVVLNQK